MKTLIYLSKKLGPLRYSIEILKHNRNFRTSDTYIHDSHWAAIIKCLSRCTERRFALKGILLGHERLRRVWIAQQIAQVIIMHGNPRVYFDQTIVRNSAAFMDTVKLDPSPSVIMYMHMYVWNTSFRDWGLVQSSCVPMGDDNRAIDLPFASLMLALFEQCHEITCFCHIGTIKPQRSACASVQSDQCLCCSLPGSYNTSTCYSQNFKTLATLISWAVRFES